jgi:hypothetical protein
VDTQEVVQQVRSGVDDRIVCLKLCDQILPPLTIAAKGQQVLSFFTLLSLYATHSIPSLCPALAQVVSIAHYCGFISH